MRRKILMGTVFAFGALLWLMGSETLAMTPAQMRELPGAGFISANPDAVFAEYGVPAVIIDHGVASRRPARTIIWGGRSLKLTDDDWTLVYSRDVGEKKDDRYWVNPEASMPGKLSDLRSLTLFTYGRVSAVLERSRRTNRLVTRAPSHVFQSHLVYQAVAVPVSPLAASDLTRKYGAGDEETLGAAGQRILRYWVTEYTGPFPANVYAVDFELDERGYASSYTVSGVRVDHVMEKYRKLFDQFRRGCAEDGADKGFCSRI